jgi:hypothetical protein
VIVPVAICRAANRVVVPFRLSSWVAFSGSAGRSGRIGWGAVERLDLVLLIDVQDDRFETGREGAGDRS